VALLRRRHRKLEAELDAWARDNITADHGDLDSACRDLVAKPGRRRLAALCRGRHRLRRQIRNHRHARHLPAARNPGAPFGLADFAFAMQGLGSGAITLHGNDGAKAAAT
jgi:acyl-CoA dehydrogenase